MAFPTIPTVASGRILTAVQADASTTRTFPSLSGLTKNAGDQLIAIIVCYSSGVTSNAFSSWGAGFDSEVIDSPGSGVMAIGVARKTSTGSETGTFTVTQASPTGHAAMILLSIPGASASLTGGGRASGTTTAADPTAISGGSVDSLFIAIGGSGETSTSGAWSGMGAAPADFTDYVETAESGDLVGAVQAAVAFRQLNTASLDVGPFTCDESNARSAAIVLALAGPVSATATPAAIVRSFTLPAPSPSPQNATATPAVIARSFTMPAVTAEGGFPLIRSSMSTGGTDLSAGSSPSLPSGAASGDLVLYHVSHDNESIPTLVGTGWTVVRSEAFTGADGLSVAIFGRVLTGTSGDNLISITGTANDYVVQGVAITTGTHNYTTSSDLTLIDSATSEARAASGFSWDADPPSLTPSGGSAAYLWFAMAATQRRGTTTADDEYGFSIPTGFTTVNGPIASASSTTAVFSELAFRKEQTATVNPTAFSGLAGTTAARVSVSVTLAIAPYTPTLAIGTVAVGFDEGFGFGEESGVDGHQGAGSPTTVVVTTTADSGAGSLREALHGTLSDRLIEFHESIHDSTISLSSTVEANGDNITVNAIGSGVIITGETLRFTGDNIVVAGLTFSNTASTSDSMTFRRNESETTDQRALVYACLFDHSGSPSTPDTCIDIIWQRSHSTYITVANCHFRYSNRGMLIHSGSTDTALEGSGGSYYVTLRNNWFDYIGQRWPLARDAHVHILNSYISNYGLAAAETTPARMGDNVNPQTGVTNGMWAENNVVKVLTDGTLDFNGDTVTTNPTNAWFSPSGSNDGTPNMKVTGSLLIAGGANNPIESDVRPENVFTPPYTYEPVDASTAMRDWLINSVGPTGAVRNEVSTFAPTIDAGLPSVVRNGDTVTVYTEDVDSTVTGVNLYYGTTDLGSMTEGVPGTWTLMLTGLTEDTTDVFFARVTTSAGTLDTDSVWVFVGESTGTILSVSDLTVSSVSDSIALTQTHNLAVSDLTISVLSDTPTLTQTHSLTVTDLAVSSILDSVVLAQTYNLTVADLTIASLFDSVSLTQVHNLVVSDLTVSVVSDSPILTQTHVLAVADLTISSVMDAVTLTQTHNLTVSDLTIAAVFDSIALTQVHSLAAVADATVLSAFDAITLTQSHNLTVADLTIASVYDAITLTQTHVLSVADLTVVAVAETVTLSANLTLVVPDVSVVIVADVPALTQTHVLAVADLTSATTIDAVVLTQTHVLSVADAVSITTIDSVTLVPDLAVEDLAVLVVADTVTLTQVHSLAVVDAIITSTIDTVSLVPTLTVSDLVVPSFADQVTLTQTHALAVSDVTAVTTIETVALVVDLAVEDLVVVTTADTVNLTQTHQLVVADLTVSVTVDSVVLAQVHVLAVSDVVSVTTIEVPTLTADAVLVVENVVVDVAIDAIVLTQTHSLTVADSVVAAVIDVVPLGVDLVVADLTIASVIDSVSLTQTHALAVSDLTISAVMDTPSLVVDLVVSDLTVVVVSDTPTLTQTHVLIVSDAIVLTTTDTVELVQAHNLTVADATVASLIDNVVLTVDAVLTVSDLIVTVVADTPALTQSHNLTVSDAVVVTTIETPSLIVDLAVSDLTVPSFIDQVTLTQTHALSVSDLIVVTTIEQPSLIVDLTVSDLTITVVSDTPSLTQTHSLVVSDTSTTVVIETPTLTQVHTLAVSDLTSVTVIESVTLTIDAVLTVEDLVVESIVDAVTLTQAHNLSVTDLTILTVIDAVTLTGASDLVVTDLVVSSVIDTPNLSQTHNLSVTDLVVDVTIDVPSLVVDLAVESLVVSTTIESPVLIVTGTSLTVEDAIILTTIDTVVLTQVHDLVVGDLTVTSTIDTVNIQFGGGPTFVGNELMMIELNGDLTITIPTSDQDRSMSLIDQELSIMEYTP